MIIWHTEKQSQPISILLKMAMEVPLVVLIQTLSSTFLTLSKMTLRSKIVSFSIRAKNKSRLIRPGGN